MQMSDQQTSPVPTTAIPQQTSNIPSISNTSSSSAVDLEAMKRRMREMEEEATKLREMQAQVERDLSAAASLEASEAIDSRSIYVGNVDYGCTPEELQAHFQSCGAINRITILCDKWTGHPKGFAYVEFGDVSGVHNAQAMNESTLRGRVIKVLPKRSNIPGYNATMRGRGGRGGPRGMMFRGGPAAVYGAMRGRSRRPGSFAPY